MATFFFDNDISFRIANALAQLVNGHDVISLRDRFPTNTLDTDWIPEAGRKEWIVISRDQNQRRREAEKRVLIASGVRVLYVRNSGTAQTLYADAARIIKNWPKIEAWGLSAKRGSMARLNTNDVIEIL